MGPFSLYYRVHVTASWGWKNICKVKEVMRAGRNGNQWMTNAKPYSIRDVYNWLKRYRENPRWSHWV